MNRWLEFTEKNIIHVPVGVLGVFQLARGENCVAYVGRADRSLRDVIQEQMSKGYTHFQWVLVPWTKEGFEMECRLYHSHGGRRHLDNKTHPLPPSGLAWPCEIHCGPVGACPV